ncbi:MAG: hypothetical protein M3Y80_00700 [Verrucomicrobiota bacterium]|nr:hypothetical protein [Verrucomicrobiota bacterium]
MPHLDLSSILNLVSTLAVVGALIFTALQVRAANHSRRDQAAVTLIQTTQNVSWTEALKLLFSLPENATPETIREHGAPMENALFEISIRLEPVGYMVFCGILSLRTVDELIGGVAVGVWSRSRAWTEEYRRSTNNDKFNEWIEWLADRISERRGRVHPQPAQLQYRNWRER